MSFICILGYGFDCPENHLNIAEELTTLLCRRTHSFCAGGYIGIFHTVFRTAKEHQAPTLLFTDSGIKQIDTTFIDTVHICPSVEEKHDAIVAKADCSIVIGGGKGSEMLANKFLSAQKKLFCLKGSGGATNNIDKATHLDIKELKEALKNI